jgi:DNA-binding NarL/FixJ family response regulator
MNWELSKEEIRKFLSSRYYHNQGRKKNPWYYKKFHFSSLMFNDDTTKALIYFEMQHSGGAKDGAFLLFERNIKSTHGAHDSKWEITSRIVRHDSHPNKIADLLKKKKPKLYIRNGTCDLSAIIIGEPSLTQNMICWFLNNLGFDIIETFSLEDGPEVLKKCKVPRIIVIMVDRGNEALWRIKDVVEIFNNRQLLPPGIMAWSENDNSTHVEVAMDMGANSFIGSEETAEDLIKAIWKTANAIKYLPPRLVQKMKKMKLMIKKSLTDREDSILVSIQLGSTNEEVADELYIGKHTVENSIKPICEKMGVTNREELYRL